MAYTDHPSSQEKRYCESPEPPKDPIFSQPNTASDAQTRLETLRSLPSNQHCADCKSTNTPLTWASWNLGIILCTRCAGIHRGLGTHISRVKSLDLDAWTEEQVRSMKEWGNEKANSVWEARMHPTVEGGRYGHVPREEKRESFVKTKYLLRKWKDERGKEAVRREEGWGVGGVGGSNSPPRWKLNLLSDQNCRDSQA